MVNTADKQGKKKGKSLHLLATLVLWGVVLFIAYDAGRYMLLYYETTQRINKAVEVNNQGNDPAKAIRAMEGARAAFRKNQAGIAPGIVQSLIGPPLDLSNKFAVLYRNLGQYHTRRQESGPAIRAYMLSLIHAPSHKKTIGKLGQECVLSKNYEVGYLASQAAQRENVEEADQLTRFFKKNYQGPAKSK